MGKPVKVRFYRLKNKLREKAVGLGNVNPEDVSFDEGMMLKAHEALQEMAEDYPDWVSTLIDNLAEEHRRCVDTPEYRKAHYEKINAIAHDMKGQGGTFGYQLITDFAEGLYNFTGPSAGMGDSHVEIIKAHIDAMRVVIKDRIEGDGGQIGTEIKKSLEAAISKYRR
ncbi:hypothetical protein [Emcibacter sp.]|uniref:hypothetical protein n=1 Tax=Emcibacter sp. TaxID=1979954 RepID=UPI003A9024F8